MQADGESRTELATHAITHKNTISLGQLTQLNREEKQKLKAPFD